MLGESKITNKSSSVLAGYHGARLLALLLLFALIPLAATIQLTQNEIYASTPLNSQPAVQNQYPENAAAGQKIVIITTVTNSSCALACVTDYDEVIVNIMVPNSSDILSTAPANPATNTVTAPETGGPWNLIVQVLWIDPPTGGTMAIYQTKITIKINGPAANSTVTTRTVSSTKFSSSTIAASSTIGSYTAVASVAVSSSTVIPYSTIISSKNFTSTSASPTTTNQSTANTPSTLPPSPSSYIPAHTWKDSTGALILAVVVTILLVGVFALKRRRR